MSATLANLSSAELDEKMKSKQSSLESLLAKKEEEVAQLQSLLEEQAVKAKAYERALSERQIENVMHNIEMVPLVNLHAEIFELRRELEEKELLVSSLQQDLQKSRGEKTEALQALSTLRQEMVTTSDALQKMSVLNMKLESEKKTMKLDISELKKTDEFRRESVEHRRSLSKPKEGLDLLLSSKVPNEESTFDASVSRPLLSKSISKLSVHRRLQAEEAQSAYSASPLHPSDTIQDTTCGGLDIISLICR